MQAAQTPVFDRLAGEGQSGLADPVAPGVVADTAAGTLAILGQTPLALRRGPVEALGAEIIVPGHGTPTIMTEVTRYTRDYLAYMRERIGALIENGGTLEDIYSIDQSAYRHLDTFDELARLNASIIFRAMEFE